MTDFHGFPSAVLENHHLRLEYLTTAGPRVVGLYYHGSPNLLADVHDATWDTPYGVYSILGGHRLWISPEIPEKTYIPDSSGLQVGAFSGGVELTGQREVGSGVRKIVRIELDPINPSVRLVHTIVNESTAPITLAPWSITQLALGGTSILPQPVGNVDPSGYLPNRFLTLWPYTRFADPRLAWRDDYILVRAQPGLPPFKLGYRNVAAWVGYWNQGVFWRKCFDLHPDGDYPDGGCNTEVYCNDRFLELESLGRLVSLAPGQAIEHVETWEMEEEPPESIGELVR
ncbi:MAG TPA: hypothetical protein VMC62_10960 [Longilinea sp.]|nr:hypothetical protein [Longilinea sp.]